jgi:thiamine-phosphate pyrophosphorylase
MKSLAECRLYAFVDSGYLKGRSPGVLARQLCDGGADLIQLRAKGAPMDQVRLWAESILPITEQAGVGLVINDHVALALAAGAPVCHLGQEDFFGSGHKQVSELRPSAARLKIGLSTHAPADARRALAAGADYLAIGPVFATPTKPTALPVGVEYVRWAAAEVRVPWFAIGGINLRNLDEVLAAGARRVCVVSALLDAADIVGTCQMFKNRLISAPL